MPLLWGWTAFYFGWQSLQFNPTMRYQLPVYPLLAMMAAWVVFEVARPLHSPVSNRQLHRISSITRKLAIPLGILVLMATALWAYAFHTIYVRDEPRIAASRWIYQNVPGPINLRYEAGSTHTTTVAGATGYDPARGLALYRSLLRQRGRGG